MGGSGSSSGKGGSGGSKTPLSQIEVNKNEYLFSVGKRPSGRGDWAFDIGGKTHFFNGTYPEATKKAKKKAQEEGQRRIKVLP